MPPIPKKIKRADVGGARRLIDDQASPSPTIMAGGIGSVNCGQYTVTAKSAAELNQEDKPPYRVPSMTEISEIPWNGLTVASVFAGCGGSSLGYRMAGFRVVWMNEFVEAARDSYVANASPITVINSDDIRNVTAQDLFTETGMKRGELDVLDGSPPCASFSMAGKRADGWGKVKKYSNTAQRTDDLFFEFARILEGIQPKMFVAENVSGLVKGVAKGYFVEILTALKNCGYRVKAKVLDAMWLGVPQQRQRVIFIGVRSDLKDCEGRELNPDHPEPFRFRYSVAEACPWIVNSAADHPEVEREADMTGYATGTEFDKMVKGTQSEKYFQLVRAEPTRPCPTVTAKGGNADLASVCHPTERRKFSMAEVKRICSFPDDFKLTGTYAQQWERCGRAVPPVMMLAVAKSVASVLMSCQTIRDDAKLKTETSSDR